MTHPTLYKRTRTGAIQQWTISVYPYDKHDDSPVDIIKEAGQLNGKLTKHVETIKEGKNIGKSNETTPLQQAESQALSDWTRKHDEGYKTAADLSIPSFITEATDEISLGLLKDALEKQLPEFNTDASGNVKPMLAKDAKPGFKGIKFPCFIQPKLDGVRCLMVVNVDQFGNALGQVVKFLSRSGKVYETLGHIEADVISYIANADPCPGSFILDGEIYAEDITFQEILQASKKLYPNSLKLKFRAYDIVNENEQHHRLQDVYELVSQINSEHITPVLTLIANDASFVKECHDSWVKEGNEGAMLRITNGKYAQGQRSSDLVKVKEFDETEFAFTGFEYGQRGVEDLIGLCETKAGQSFKAKMQGSKQIKEGLDDDWRGRIVPGMMITVKHFGLTDDGIPRFPIGKALRKANKDY